MARHRDFDAARAEHAQEPLTFRLGGEDFTTSGDLPAGALLDLGAAAAGDDDAATFGAFSSVRTLSGILQYDTFQTATLGNELWFGLLATPRVVITGDTLVIAAGALTSQIN